jgi:replicative DNA helicase
MPRDDLTRPQGGPASPYNAEAEQGLLGCILVTNKAYEKVAEFLRAEHFYDPVHARIYEAIETTIEAGRVADPVTLRGLFEQDPDIRGGTYLADLAANIVSIINAEHYGHLIYDMWLRRQMIDEGHALIAEAANVVQDVDARAVLESHEQRLFALAEHGIADAKIINIRDAGMAAVEQARLAYENQGRLVGVPTGLTDLDRTLCGLQRSDLIILAGRPSMGKTALAINSIARAAAESGEKTLVFELEMSARQLAARQLAGISGISTDRQMAGRFASTAEWQCLVDAQHELEALRETLYIDDTPGITLAQMRQRARRHKRRHGLGLIVVDHIGLMGASRETAAQGRVQVISEFTRGLKRLAKELQVPVVALSQLSRAVEQREDKRPMLSDLRDSGTIEQDADVVMFVFREQYYLERAEPVRRADESDDKFNDRVDRWQQRLQDARNIAEIIVAKNRMGPIRTIRTHFDGERTLFSDLSPRDS